VLGTRETLPQIEREYISTGKVKYVFRDFPIETIHPQAFKGHEAARCAGDQGKLWEMHSRLFTHQRAMSPDDLSDHAQALDLDATSFQVCLDSSKHAPGIRTSLADGQKAGVSGTPTFFLGYTEPSDPNIKIVRMLRGAQSYANFKEAIESLLSSRQQ